MTKIVLRIDFNNDDYIGHGRVRLLELIGEHGSIARAAREMGMSYKRAWYLIDSFGACFSEPLLERHHGGKGGGSAKLTAFGNEVVHRYRAMEAKALKACLRDVAALEQHLASPGHKAKT